MVDKAEAFDKLADAIIDPRKTTGIQIDSKNFANFIQKLEAIIDQVTEGD